MKAKVNNRRGNVGKKSNVNPSNLTDKHWKSANIAKMERMQNKMRRIEEKHKADIMFFETKIMGYED